MFDYIIISDVHIGSPQFNQYNLFIDMIKNIKTRNIIINGDLFDLWANPKMDYLTIYRELKKITNADIHYIIGNHDFIVNKYIPTLKYMNICVDGKNIKITHGHKYDSVCKKPWLDKLIVKINIFFLKIFKIDLQYLGRKLFAKNYPEGKFLPSLYNLRLKAIENIKKEGYDGCVLGHIHYPEKKLLEGNFIYTNSGDWIKNKSFIGIKDNEIKLYNYEV